MSRSYVSMKLLAFTAVFACLNVSSFAQTATYTFGGSLNANEGGVSALTATNPFNQNAYSTASIYGGTRTVYDEFGFGTTNLNSGLTFDDSAGTVDANNYTMELVMSFNDTGSIWRKIADWTNRVSDGGLYVDPSNFLSYYPGGPGYDYYHGPDTFAAGYHNFHYVALSFDGTTTKTYLDGALQASVATTTASIDNNPGKLVNLFLDDAGTSYKEYSDSSVALVRFTNGTLGGGDIAGRAANPFAAVPEPTTMAALAIGAIGLLKRKRR